MIRQGANWCDVTVSPSGEVAFVYARGTEVVAEDATTGAALGAIQVQRSLLYLRAAADRRGRICAIGQGHDDGQSWIVLLGSPSSWQARSFGRTHGVCPVAVIARDDADGWVLFIQTDPDRYDRIVLTGVGEVHDWQPIAMPPTSQGFLYVAADGTPITQDRGRGAIPGLALPSPAPGGAVWAGQSMVAETLALFDSETGIITSLNTPGGQPPHIVESGGTYFVCSYVEGGAWLSTHRRPFSSTPPPVEPPPPPPVEPPKETPVRLEQKHSDLIDAFAAKFPPPGGNEDELRDHWTPKLIEQFVFSFPNEGWCWKSTSPGGRPSSDVIARQAGGGMWGYDLIPNAGTSAWRLESNAGPIDLRTQASIRMNPVNHLGSTQPPPGTPPTQPPVPPPAQRPFPTFTVPEDVFLHALTRYVQEGLWDRDRPIENPEGDRTAGRGALMWFVPIFYNRIIGFISKKGNLLPNADEWWRLADEGAEEAIRFYRQRQPAP